jgi:hypothetical protein
MNGEFKQHDQISQFDDRIWTTHPCSASVFNISIMLLMIMSVGHEISLHCTGDCQNLSS